MDATPRIEPEQTVRLLREENDRLREEKATLERRVTLLERQISLQPQTGLPTHFRLELELDELIDDLRSAPGEKGGFTVLIIQLGENYTVVRKTLKASVSEWILYQIGCRISSLLGDDDKVFHTRENEFVLLLPGRKGESLVDFLRKLLPRLHEPHIFSGFNVVIGLSAGAAYWPEHGVERSALMHHADIAVGAAAEGRKAFVLFRPRLLEKAVERIELQNSIIKAIEASAFDRIGEQFFLAFQPKIFVRSLEGRTLVVDRIEAEALIRWQHPEKGLLLPSTFVPLAEETGLILPLGKWLLYQCARRLASWGKGGRGDVGLSVNLSARQFRSEDMASTLETIIKHTGVSPELLTIELTETCLFENPIETTSTLELLWEMGCRGFQGFLIAKPLSAADFLAFRDRIVAGDMRLTF